jgi:hypothetical protein
MKKLGIVITDGVGFRNFILSDFLIKAEQSFDQVVILSCLPKEVYEGFISKTKVIELEVFVEKFSSWFFRKTKEVAHLQLHKKNNFGIIDNINVNKKLNYSNRGLATQLIFKWTHWFHSEKWIQRYLSLQEWSFRNDSINKNYKNLLVEEQFDILFFTHQRPPYIAPLVCQARNLNIKTSTFIFSWDNLASKGRMTSSFDFYLVWSELMKNELLRFYTSVRSNQIEVVGTPQFEPYVLARYKTEKDDFFKKFDLDKSKKTICFSCGDIATSRNDELYIAVIANAILTKKIPDLNIIVRTSPAENPNRFDKVKEDFPFIKWNYPKWNLARKGHQEEWSQRVPSVEDIKDLRAILEFSDININMLSTMSLDFIQFDKPVINVVFGNSENNLYNDQRFLNYEHIVNVVISNATKIAKNDDELINAINQYSINSKQDSENRKDLLKLQVSKPIEGTSKRIAETLLKWS